MPQKIDNSSEHKPQISAPEHKKTESKKNFNIFEDGKLFGKFETDDIILIAVVLILLADDCDDKLLLLAIGFIFASGILEF